MSLFGSSSTGAGSAPTLPRSVSFGGQDNKPSFSFGNTQTAQPNAGAKPGGLFGASSTTPAQGGSLFGAPSTGPAGQSTGAFGTQNSPQATQSTSLFGQNNPAPSGGLFGAQNQAQTASTANASGSGGPSGGLFGSQNNTTQPNSLFGAAQPKPSLFGASSTQPGASGGLFGQSQTNTTQPSGGLFGQSQPNPTQSSGGLFGQSQTNQTQPSGGLFGQSQPSQTQPSGGLFGAKPAGGLFGASAPAAGTSGGLFGASSTAPGPAQPASALLQYPYYQRERFNELPDAQRTLLEEMDKYIQSQVQIKNELRARDQASEPRHLPSEIHELMALQESLTASLEADVLRLQTINARVERDRVDQLQLHNIAQHAKDKLSDGSSFVDWLRNFYQRATEDDLARIHRYRVTMEQIERHLLSLDQREQFAPQVIAEIIYDQNASFMGLAEQIATLHAEIDTLKKDYVKWYQARYQSVRDPFAPGVSVAEGA